MTMLSRTNSFNSSLIIILGLISLLEYVTNFFENNVTLTNVYIVQVILIFGLGVLETVKKVGLYHIFTLTCVTFFIFVLGGIAISPFFEVSIRVALSPDYEVFSEPTVQRALLIYAVFFSISFSYFIQQPLTTTNLGIWSNNASTEDSDYRNRLYGVGRNIMIGMLPFAFYYNYLFLQNDLRTSAFIEGGIAAPLYLRLTHMLFLIGFYCVVASVPKRRNFIFCFIIYLLTMIPIVLGGERGDFVVPIIFFVWYNYKFYGYKINILKLVGLAIAVMLFSYFISFARRNETMTEGSILTLLFGFLAESATSLKLLCFYIVYHDHIMAHTYPFFLDSLIGGMLPAAGQSLETLQIRSSIGHQLVYEINPNYYLAGHSMGTSFITEAYEFGIIGVIISAFVFIKVILFFEKYVEKSRIGKYFLFYMFTIIILSPRGALLPGIYDLLKYGIIGGGILMLFNLKLINKK